MIQMKITFEPPAFQKKAFTCPNCSTNNVELTTCAKCGKTICEACETFELSDNKSYCSSCYSE